MPQNKKAGATKRTFRLDDEMMVELMRIASAERRTLTAQLELFVWEKIQEYKKREAEKTPGQIGELENAA